MVKKKKTATVQSLERGLNILRIIAEADEPLGLQELAARLDVDPSTAFRLANTLVRHGLLSQSPESKRYSLGAAIPQLAGHMVRSGSVLTSARPFIRALVDQTEETAHLSVLQDDRAVSLEHRLTTHVVGVGMTQGRSEPLYCSAVGKALLFDLDFDSMKELVGDQFERRTPRTIATLEALYAENLGARKLGYAIDDQEYSPGVCCVGAPVRDHTAEIVAAVGISAPSSRLPAARMRIVGGIVSGIAMDFSRTLGFVPHGNPA